MLYTAGLRDHASSIFFSILPRPEDRIPHSPQAARYYIIPFSLLFVMGGLARRKNTWVLRLALLPPTAFAILYGGFGFISFDPEAVGDMVGQGSYFSEY